MQFQTKNASASQFFRQRNFKPAGVGSVIQKWKRPTYRILKNLLPVGFFKNVVVTIVFSSKWQTES
jgi:hypothetical protein